MTPSRVPVYIGPLRVPGILFAAPMAGYSDHVSRAVALDYGADMAYTEMISAEALNPRALEAVQASDLGRRLGPDRMFYNMQFTVEAYNARRKA